MKQDFSISRLPQDVIHSMKHKGVWSDECPVALDRLRLLEVVHYNFEGEQKAGRIVTLDAVSESALRIFQELWKLKFPINSIKPIDDYDGDDELSMSDNNSSCFNFRTIAGTSNLSMHSYGLAIDINPVQNPYIVINDNNDIAVFPKQGVEFLNRGNIRPGMVEQIVDIFKQNGFEQWGGNWNSPIDYHHFQASRNKVDELLW